jgi:hypothetical protein
MAFDDLNRLKAFIRVSLDLERSLGLAGFERDLVMRVMHFWELKVEPNVSDVLEAVMGLSKRKLFHYLSSLHQKDWVCFIDHPHDRRQKIVLPSPKLLSAFKKFV